MKLVTRVITAIGFALALFAGTPALAQTTPTTPPNRLVVQVSDGDPARWNMVLNNIKNVQSELGKNVEIELVA